MNGLMPMRSASPSRDQTRNALDLDCIACRDCGYDLRAHESSTCPECGLEFDRSDRRTFSSLHRSPRQRAATLIGLGLVVAVSAYVAAYFRSQDFGPSFGSIVATVGCVAVLVAPIVLSAGAIVQTLRPAPGRGRRSAVAIAWIACFAALLAELWCLPQEIRFRHRCRSLPPGSATVFEERWWPYSNHHIGYLPATGQWFGGE
jgi:hypothetical protein